MSILNRDRYPVKPIRRTPRPPSPFGAGLLRGLPVYRQVASPEDEQWAIHAFQEQREREERAALEQAADEALTVEQMAEGWRW
jgi:hypothetical protein